MSGINTKISIDDARRQAKADLRRQLITEQHAECHRGGEQLTEQAIHEHVDVLLGTQYHRDTIDTMADALMNRSSRGFPNMTAIASDEDPTPAPSHVPSNQT